MRHLYTLALVLTPLMGAYAQEKAPAQNEPAPSKEVAAQPAGEVTKEYLVTDSTVGPVTLGMKLDDLKKKLGKGYEYTLEENYMVDINAVTVSKGGEELFSILFLAGEPLEFAGWVVTKNPKYKLKTGVGPGTKVADAAKIYGKPHLSYSIHDEGREWLRFPGNEVSEPLPGQISFRASQPGEEFPGKVGIYPFEDKKMQEGTEYFETDAHKDNAVIQSLWIEMVGC